MKNLKLGKTLKGTIFSRILLAIAGLSFALIWEGCLYGSALALVWLFPSIPEMPYCIVTLLIIYFPLIVLGALIAGGIIGLAFGKIEHE